MPDNSQASSVPTTVFMSGNSQALRIPKEFRFDSDTVWLKRIGKRLYVSERPMSAMDVVNEITAGFPPDWADDLEEPKELPLDPISGWD